MTKLAPILPLIPEALCKYDWLVIVFVLLNQKFPLPLLLEKKNIEKNAGILKTSRCKHPARIAISWPL
jgi:hypothetical protein